MRLYDATTGKVIAEEVKRIAFQDFEGSLFVEMELEDDPSYVEWPECALVEVGGVLVAELFFFAGEDSKAELVWFK